MIIYSVITSYHDFDEMEEINRLTGVSDFNTDNWCNYSCFEDEPKLKNYITKAELEALKTNQADYIAFRLDR